MGRLQDNQYASPRTNKHPQKKKQDKAQLQQDRARDEAKLQAAFCPPLDPSLIQAIWNDSFDYDGSFEILTSLAKEADRTLDGQQEQELSMDTLELDDSSTTRSSQSEDDHVEFLMTCFPTLPMQELIDALRQSENDVEKATDILLNQEFISQVDKDGGAVVKKDDEYYQGQKKNKQQKKTKKKNTNPTIWSSGQLPTVNSALGNASNPGAVSISMRKIMQQQQEQEDEDPYQALASVPFNYWHQHDATVKQLQRHFPRLPEMTIAAAVQHCRGNVIASVKTLMEKHPNEKPEHEMTWPVMKELINVRQELQAIMVDRSEQDVIGVAVGVMIQFEGQNKLLDQLVQAGIEHFLTFDVSQLALEARLKKMAEESEWIRVQNKKKEIPVIPEYLLINNQQTYQEDDPEECRDVAMQLILERNELFRKAAAAYRAAKNKGPGEGGVAFFYSDTARQLDSQAKDWNMRAARATVRRQRIKQNDDHLLDLHGLTVAEAQILVTEGVTQWYSRSQMQSARLQFRPLKIITGVGKHSKYGESKLLPTTLKILKNGGWQYEMSHPGCIYVKGVKSTNK
ncbi:uncharacterized protein B0P05DRAFT_595093 [Gilbertella persicaria]|uniref:uncharacterized protein n=1 Tax=Gilbertella persicaria TaxID=101096 RepID=UPI002220C45B|nr:uncharacterized protein B0P05DRAFT_595093 [Gilbertella persicaria]KAI8086868.1 hypothetical protein B0P05DRAFT_595093 [Gilbertella persicaria]